MFKLQNILWFFLGGGFNQQSLVMSLITWPECGHTLRRHGNTYNCTSSCQLRNCLAGKLLFMATALSSLVLARISPRIHLACGSGIQINQEGRKGISVSRKQWPLWWKSEGRQFWLEGEPEYLQVFLLFSPLTWCFLILHLHFIPCSACLPSFQPFSCAFALASPRKEDERCRWKRSAGAFSMQTSRF